MLAQVRRRRHRQKPHIFAKTHGHHIRRDVFRQTDPRIKTFGDNIYQPAIYHQIQRHAGIPCHIVRHNCLQQQVNSLFPAIDTQRTHGLSLGIGNLFQRLFQPVEVR